MAQLETAAVVSVSCIRVHISEIGEIDAPGTWGQCKYYAYRGASEEGGHRRGKGNVHRMDIDRPPQFLDDTRDPSSPLALKCANNQSALAFHLGMPALFYPTNSIHSSSFLLQGFSLSRAARERATTSL